MSEAGEIVRVLEARVRELSERLEEIECQCDVARRIITGKKVSEVNRMAYFLGIPLKQHRSLMALFTELNARVLQKREPQVTKEEMYGRVDAVSEGFDSPMLSEFYLVAYAKDNGLPDIVELMRNEDVPGLRPGAATIQYESLP
jgi:hypothetical protein